MKLIFYLLSFLIFLSSCSDKKENSGTSNDTLRLITHNVYYGFTKIPQRKEDWLNWIKNQNPDIVALQELNEYNPEQLAQDAAHWGHDYSLLLKENGFPTGITSRFPMDDMQRYTEGFHHGLIRVKIKGIYIYIIHLHPSNWEFRHREVDQLLENISTLPPDSRVILAGDFNTFSPEDSSYYRHGRLEVFFQHLDSIHQAKNLNDGKLDFTAIQKITDWGLIDLELSHRPENYLFTGTFPGLVQQEGQHGDLRRLDYIFINENLKSNVQRAGIIANDSTQYLSDHLPVVADFTF